MATQKKRRTPSPKKLSLVSFLVALIRLIIGIFLVALLVLVIGWLVWQQIPVSDKIQGVVIESTDGIPSQVIISQYVRRLKRMQVLSIPLDSDGVAATGAAKKSGDSSGQGGDAAYFSQIMREIGVLVPEWQQSTASPAVTNQEVLRLLIGTQPKKSWSAQKEKRLLMQDSTVIESVTSPSGVAGSKFVKLLRVQGNVFCSVAIVNAANQNGLATQVSAVVENTGARVVQITTSEVVEEESKILYANETCLDQAKTMTALTPYNNAPSFNTNLGTKYRADIIILLGSDILAVN